MSKNDRHRPLASLRKRPSTVNAKTPRELERRPFGRTGLTVSALGFGAGQIGDPGMPENDIGHLLNELLDAGITLIDTARSYALSEERIGRHLHHRRKEFVLSTKVGYGIQGHEDWTYGCVIAGIDEALRRLQTDFIDVVHLHSCPIDTLKKEDPIRALEDAVKSGKVKVAAYSGENDALDWAVESGRFGSVQHSINICDQRSIDGTLNTESGKGLGVIAKRALANVPWRFADCPKGTYCEEYWWRWKTMNIDPHGIPWDELALRFTAFTPGVCSLLVGTGNVEHVHRNISMIAKGPLPSDLYDSIRSAFHKNDPGWWRGEV